LYGSPAFANDGSMSFNWVQEMKLPKLNKVWHAKHKMPANATLEQRIRWHLAHPKHCGCRPIPSKLAAEMRSRGLLGGRRHK
jgi:hypothetical protein